MNQHISVFKQEAIDCLNIKPTGIYVDGTFGRGGHSLAICQKLTTGKLIATDLDQAAIDFGNKMIKDYHLENKLLLYKSNFCNIENILLSLEINKVDGILLDLGVSSPQFDTPERGFSYRYDSLLDMRMNQEQELSALEMVNEYSKEKLIKILYEYGEEKFAYKIVEKIIENRPLMTTFDLVAAIKSALPAKVLNSKGHPAKKTFQALRIAVNGELDSLQLALESMPKLLNVNGVLAIISFHSLEDRLVKKAFNQLSKPQKINRRVPILELEKLDFLSRKIMISDLEVLENNRAHSAILRILERIN